MEQDQAPSNDVYDPRPLRVGLLGCGTVGTEVAHLLSRPGIPGLRLDRASAAAVLADLEDIVRTDAPLPTVRTARLIAGRRSL